MRLLLLLAAIAATTGTALAQVPVPVAIPKFEGITLGEPIAGLKQRMGDPVQVISAGGTVIWRYLAAGGAIFIDVLVKENAASSVTVVRRIRGGAYTDANGAAFGMNAQQLRAKLGAPARTTTNADDGSVDLWYYGQQYAWIYEFYSDNLGFIQLIPSPSVAQSFAPGPPTAPSAGSSLDTAIWIRPSNLLANTMWIDAYLAMTSCGNNAHWKQTSSKIQPDTAKNDPLAYAVVHARCSDGSAERDFYFDMHGTLGPSGSVGKPLTIYVDPSQLPDASPSPETSRPPA